MTTPLFDRYIMVDWSASKRPARRPKPDSIWLGHVDRGCTPALDASHVCVEHSQSRNHAVDRVIALASEARSLIGFDFAFGLPTFSDNAPYGRELSRFFRSAYFTGGTEEGCRFRAAAAFNRRFSDGEGPFYSRVGFKDAIQANIRRAASETCLSHPLRTVDRLTQAKSPWQMTGQGAVGSQTVVGLAWLDVLFERLDAALWPFETVRETHAIVEIYPTHHQCEYLRLPGRTLFDGINDARQVAASAEWFRTADADGYLEGMLSLNGLAPQDRTVATTEGWILGVR